MIVFQFNNFTVYQVKRHLYIAVTEGDEMTRNAIKIAIEEMTGEEDMPVLFDPEYQP
jgi:hypothetical protein